MPKLRPQRINPSVASLKIQPELHVVQTSDTDTNDDNIINQVKDVVASGVITLVYKALSMTRRNCCYLSGDYNVI